MKNIVVATQKNIGYYSILEKSCKKHNIELIPLGLGKKEKELHQKIHSMYILSDKENKFKTMVYDISDRFVISDVSKKLI